MRLHIIFLKHKETNLFNVMFSQKILYKLLPVFPRVGIGYLDQKLEDLDRHESMYD